MSRLVVLAYICVGRNFKPLICVYINLILLTITSFFLLLVFVLVLIKFLNLLYTLAPEITQTQQFLSNHINNIQLLFYKNHEFKQKDYFRHCDKQVRLYSHKFPLKKIKKRHLICRVSIKPWAGLLFKFF